MKKSENKFTVKFTISSQNVLSGCELIVNQNASYALISSNIGVNLKNKQGYGSMFSKLRNERMKHLPILSLNPGFVRSLFAHYSLFVRSKSEGTASILNPKSDSNRTVLIPV